MRGDLALPRAIIARPYRGFSSRHLLALMRNKLFHLPDKQAEAFGSGALGNRKVDHIFDLRFAILGRCGTLLDVPGHLDTRRAVDMAREDQ